MKNSSLLLLFNFGILFYFVWTLASRFIAIALLLSNFGRVLFQGSFTWYLCLHQTSNFSEPVLRQIVHWDITVFQGTVHAKTFFQDKICIIFNYLRSREMWTGSVIFQPLWVRIKAGQTWTAEHLNVYHCYLQRCGNWQLRHGPFSFNNCKRSSIDPFLNNEQAWISLSSMFLCNFHFQL